MTKYPYGPSFWWTYLANTSLMVAVSLLFRYADFITFLGGTEKQLGLITGLGMIGAIMARCFQGMAIDRYGPRLVWILSLILLIVCLLLHPAIRSLQPPLIHILRILYTVGLAGAFGASLTYISLRAPPNRMAEMIGMLGSSGFVGMAIGPAIGDWLFAGADQSATSVTQMFLWAAGSVSVSLVCILIASRDGTTVIPDRRTPHVDQLRDNGGRRTTNPLVTIWHLVRTYHPGLTLLVGVAMGIGIGMPGTFLRTFGADRGFAGLRNYFLMYALVAFLIRICARQLPDRWGTRPTILLGLGCLATSMLTYLFVTTTSTLFLPAVLAGAAHAFLFPAAVAEGSQSFPPRYRGLATNLVLTMFDVGMLIGQPLIGVTVEFTRSAGWDGYFVAFTGLAVLMLGVAIVYAVGKSSVMIVAADPQPPEHAGHVVPEPEVHTRNLSKIA